jgi:hypothetical protein
MPKAKWNSGLGTYYGQQSGLLRTDTSEGLPTSAAERLTRNVIFYVPETPGPAQ